MNRARLSSLIAAAVIVAIILVGWFGAISPQLLQVSQAKEQVSAVDAQNQVLAQALATLKTQSAGLPKLKKQLDALRLQLPDSVEIDAFVSELQALAAANGVELASLTVPEVIAYPAGPVAPAPAPATGDGSASTAVPTPAPVATDLTTPTTTPTTSPTDVQPSPALRANLYTLNLTLSAIGPGPALISFLNAVQKGSRIFLVTTVSLTTQAPDSLGTATIGGYLFMVSTPAEIAAKAAEATAPAKPKPTASPTPTPTPTPTPSSTPLPEPSPSDTPAG